MVTAMEPDTDYYVAVRTCNSCGETKPLEEFYLRAAPENPNRRHRQCKVCHNRKRKELKTARRASAEPPRPRAPPGEARKPEPRARETELLVYNALRAIEQSERRVRGVSQDVIETLAACAKALRQVLPRGAALEKMGRADGPRRSSPETETETD